MKTHPPKRSLFHRITASVVVVMMLYALSPTIPARAADAESMVESEISAVSIEEQSSTSFAESLASIPQAPASSQNPPVEASASNEPSVATSTSKEDSTVPSTSEAPPEEEIVEPETPSETSTPTESKQELYTVRFLDFEGKAIGEVQNITPGGAATAPQDVPVPEGQAFIGWNSDAYLNVQSNLDIQAVYDTVDFAAMEMEMETSSYSKIKVWAEDLIVSDTSKEYGSPDPKPILLGLPSNLVAGVDYVVDFKRDPGENITNVGYAVCAINFRFLNSRYVLQGDESAMKEGRLYITTRKITITANSSSKVYDGTPLTNNGFTVGGSGLASGNTASAVITGSQTNVGSSANTVGSVTIKNSSNNDVTSCYTITKVNGTLTVTKAPLIIKADNKIINYGDPVPAFTFTYTGFVAGQNSNVLTSPPVGSTTYTVGSNQGVYPITVSGAAAANYAISYQQGNITVHANGSQITITAPSASKTYDGTPLQNGVPSVSGLPAGFTAQVVITGSVTNVADSATGNNIVTSVVILNSSSQDVTANFSNIVKVAGNLSITPAPLTAKMQDLNIEYNDPKPASFPVEYTGFVNGEDSSVLTSQTTASCSYVQGDAPGSYTINGSGAAAANYAITYIPGNLCVSRISTQITVTAASANKVYDGTALTNADYTTTGLAGEYTLTADVTGSATNVADTAPGNNVVSNIVIRNGANQDVTAYFSNIVSVNGTLSITPAVLTIEMDDISISYTDPVPEYTMSYTGFVGGDTVGVLTPPATGSSTYTPSSPPGAYTINGSGAVADNYTINYLPGILTVYKDSSQITVIASSASKVYDGTDLTSSTYNVTGLPALHTVSLTITGSVKNVADSATGNNVISDFKIFNASSEDVTSFFPNILLVNGNLTILPAPLVAEMKDYVVEVGDPVPTYEVIYTGFVPGETETVITSPTVATCSYTTTSIVGSYEITGSGAAAANYTISYLPGFVTVTPDSSQITVLAKYASKVYDGTPLEEPGYTVTGLDPAFRLDAIVTGSITNVADNEAGNNKVTSFKIYDSGDNDVTGSFSNIVTVDGSLVITPAPLVAQVENKTIQFADPAPAYTVDYTGFVGGEDSSVVHDIEFHCSYTEGSPFGSYPITADSATAENYTITYLPGTLTVHKNDVKITLVAGYATKIYDGTELTKESYTRTGDLPNGYSFEVIVEGEATDVSDSVNGNNKIKSYKILNSADEDVTANFSNIETVDGTLTITPAPLLAQMDNLQIQYADAPPSYTVTYNGFVNGEDETVLTSPTTAACAYVTGNDAGSYPITGSGAAADNYTVTYINGNLLVTPYISSISIVSASANKVYDGNPLSDNTFTVSGTLPANHTVQATVSASATNVADSVPGNNTITDHKILNGMSQDVTANFANVTTVNGSFTITPAPLVIEMKDLVIEYNDAPPAYDVLYYGFVGAESELVLTNPTVAACSYTQGSPSGAYLITGSGATADNYTITYLDGTLTVKTFSDQITVMANNASKQYDGTPLTNNGFTYDNLPLGYTLDATVLGSATKVADSTPGNNLVTNVVIRNLADEDVTSNFSNIVKVPGTLTITPAPLTITIDTMHVEFGSPPPAYHATYSGFVNGENESVLIQTEAIACPYTSGAPIGSYLISSHGAVAANYTITYIDGSLIVDTSDDLVTIEAGNMSREYDGKPLTDQVIHFSGLPAGYTVTAVTEGSVTNVGTTVKNIIKSYKIMNTSNQDVTNSFANVKLVEGNLSVTPKDVLVIAANKNKMVGEADPELTATVEGAVAGETIAYTLNRESGEKAGTYKINVVAGTNPNYLVETVPGLFTISDQTKPVEHTILGTTGSHGSISPSGSVIVKDKASQKFTFKPDSGYHVSKVLVDGKEVKVDGNSYTFKDVTKNHTIHVLFEKDADPNSNTSSTPATSTINNNGIPKTGDTTNVLLWAFIAMLSLFGLAALMIVKKKTGKSNNSQHTHK